MYSQNMPILSSPDGNLKVKVDLENGKPMYLVTYKDKTMIEKSPLGLLTNEGDFSTNISFVESTEGEVDKKYLQDKIKKAFVKYNANT